MSDKTTLKEIQILAGLDAEKASARAAEARLIVEDYLNEYGLLVRVTYDGLAVVKFRRGTVERIMDFSALKETGLTYDEVMG